MPGIRTEITVHHLIVSGLESTNCVLGAQTEVSIRLSGQIAESNQSVLIFLNNLTLFSQSNNIRLNILGVKQVDRSSSHCSVHSQMVYFLQFLYSRFGIRIKSTVNLSTFGKISEIIQTILDFRDIVTLKAELCGIVGGIIRHECIPGIYPGDSVHSSSRLSLEVLHGLGSSISIVSSRLIIFHVAKLHESFLQILYHRVNHTHGQINRCKFLCLPVNSHAFYRWKDIGIEAECRNGNGLFSTVFRSENNIGRRGGSSFLLRPQFLFTGT